MQVYPHSLIGYRAWYWDETLKSLGFGRDYQWQRVNQACCKKTSHQAPKQDCSCGLHAFYHLSDATRYVEDLFDVDRSIVGVVAAQGNTQMHKEGFRAQQMQILGFYLYKHQKYLKKSLENAFHVKIFLSSEDMLNYVNAL